MIAEMKLFHALFSVTVHETEKYKAQDQHCRK